MSIEYADTDGLGLDQTIPLRRKLYEHHEVRSTHWPERFAAMNASTANKELLEALEKDAIRIDLARDTNTDEIVGYCISIIHEDKRGEIASIYVESDYRGMNIGDGLMQRALCWLDERSLSGKILAVGAGNEEVFAFYSRYGFQPRMTIPEQVEGQE